MQLAIANPHLADFLRALANSQSITSPNHKQESIVNKITVLATIAAAALVGAAFLSDAGPAAAKDYEFCQQDYSSNMRSCDFETMEQCVAMISGRGGSCTRNPLRAETSRPYASAPKSRARHHR